MNLRGQVISVIDLRIKLGMKPQVTERNGRYYLRLTTYQSRSSS
jgi:chemotaxis signal transduction protein